MRLWHYKLIPYLPKDMLVSQWRECIAIKRQWEKGTLKHRLVSYVQEYNDNLYLYYVKCVAEEMYLRGIKYQTKFYKEIASEHNELIQEVRSKYKSIATVWHENYDADTFNTLLEYVMRFPKETQKTEIQEFAYKAISFMRNCEGCGRQDYPTIKEYIQGKR